MKFKYARWIAVAVLLGACDSPLDVDPTASIPAESALKNAREVELAVNGAYQALQTSALYNRELTVFPEMYADNLEFTGTYPTDQEVYNRSIFPANSAIRDMWRNSYRAINRANTVIAAIPSAADLTGAKRDRFMGEALFLRALNYLNLVRYFGGVPILTEPTKTVTEESKVKRSTVEEVYQQIEKDLLEAAKLLPATNGVGHATSWSANALLARAYLEQNKWTDARDKATAVIESGRYQLVGYRELFENKNGKESILELQYNIKESNSLAFWYFTDALGGRWGFAPTQGLYDAYEAGDVRRDASIGISGKSRYGIKYFRISGGDDNVIVLRLAEMYLIRAEANARLGADAAAVRADIDVVRNRAGLADLPETIAAEEELIDAILQERRVEFAMEGHRFFDLRRTGRAMALLKIDKNHLVFPIPQAERDVNNNLDQNDGY